MNLLIAPDSFKGCLSSEEVCAAIAKGAINSDPNVNIKQIPSSDGGEGFCSSMKNIFGGEWISREVTYPLGNKGIASYVYNRETYTAYIELASAAGLSLVSEKERDIMSSTTFGVGELIADAIKCGATKIVVGLGGSATNDCGIGLLSALGMRFLDASGNELAPVAASLARVVSVDKSAMTDPLEISFVAACDVKNKLCGSNGAAEVYSRQKGASESEVKLLDNAAKSFADALGIDPDVEGSGAAGGVGAAMLSVLGAEYVSGAALLVSSDVFQNALDDADLVITGEGNTDAQTACGKLVSVVASAAKTKGVPVIVLSGGLSDGYERLTEHGVTAFYSLKKENMSLDYCIENAYELLAKETANIISKYKKAML